MQKISKQEISANSPDLDLDLDLETFCTEVRSTLEDDRWVQQAHISVAVKEGKRGA